MLTSVFTTGAVYGLEPDDCQFGSSAIAVILSPDPKGKSKDSLNVDVSVKNNSDSFKECNLRVDTVKVTANAVPVCEAVIPGGLIVVGGPASVPLWKKGGLGAAPAGNTDSIAGACTFIPDNHAAPANAGPWSLIASITGVNFNTADDAFPDPANASTPGGIALAQPKVSLVKTSSVIKEAINPDDATAFVEVNWKLVVKNESTIGPLTNCVVTDDQNPAPVDPFNLGGISDPPASREKTVEYTTKITKTTPNFADVVCKDQSGDDVTAKSDVTPVIYKPKVTIDKVCDKKVKSGEQATCNINVANASPDIPKTVLNKCVVKDPKFSLVTAEFTLDDANPTKSFGPFQTPPLTEKWTNTATIDCVDQEGIGLNAEATAIVEVGNFDVNIKKTCDGKVVVPFDKDIKCSITVDAPLANTEALTKCNITDPTFGGHVAGPFNLNPGASSGPWGVSRAITQADIDAGKYANTATVTCSSQDNVDNISKSDNSGGEVRSISATATEVCTPKSQQGQTGDITWTITLCNTSVDGVSGLTIDGSGTIQQCDKDGNNCLAPVAEAQKTVVGLALPASKPFDATVSCKDVIVTKNSLGEGQYTDLWSGTAKLGTQAGPIKLDAQDTCKIETPSDFGGCTPGYWKANADNRGAVNWFVPTSTTVQSVFSEAHKNLDGISPADDTLRNALDYKGGKGLEGAERNLLRAATAAYLNAGLDDSIFVFGYGDTGKIVADVNKAIVDGYANNDRQAMLSLASVLDGWNNFVDENGVHCPLDNSIHLLD